MTTKKTPPPGDGEHEDQVDQNAHHDLPADAPAGGDLTRRGLSGVPPWVSLLQRRAAASS